MNNKEILTEEEVRKWVRDIVQGTRSVKNKANLLEYMDYGYSPDPDQFYQAFIAPFTDVLKVAQVASKRILSAAKLNFDLITTISPSKQEKLLADYETRKEKIDAEMDKAMESTNKVLEEGDAQLFGFMMNPVGYLGAKTLQKTPGTAKATKEYLQDAGFFGGPSDSDDKKKSDSGDGTVDIKGTAGKLLGDLAKLFFIAHHAPDGPILREAPEEGESKDEKSGSASQVAGWIADAFTEDGAELERIGAAAKEALAAKEDQFKELKEELDPKREITLALVNASNLDEFGEALQKANSAGVDLGSLNPAQVKKDMEEAVTKLLENPKARAELEKKLGIKSKEKPVEEGLVITEATPPEDEKKPESPEGEKASQSTDAQAPEDAELKTQAENVIFTSAKEDMMSDISSSVTDLRKSVGDILLAPDAIIPEKDVKIASGTKIGRDYVTLQEEMLKYIKSL